MDFVCVSEGEIEKLIWKWNFTSTSGKWKFLIKTLIMPFLKEKKRNSNKLKLLSSSILVSAKCYK